MKLSDINASTLAQMDPKTVRVIDEVQTVSDWSTTVGMVGTWFAVAFMIWVNGR